MSSVLFDLPGPRAKVRHRFFTVAAGIILGGILAWAVWQLWEKEQITPDKWEAFVQPNILLALLEGLVETLIAAAAAITLALVFAAVFASGRLSDHALVRWPSIVVIEFFRAVPLLLLILFLFLGFIGDALGAFWALVIALTLYNGSVLAEIFRAGILSVPRGQREAAYAVGMRKSQVMALVLAPQALRSMLPAIIGQCVVALKDTALGYIIGEAGIVDVGQSIYQSPQFNNPFATALVLAFVFIVINYSLSRLAVYLESRQRRARDTGVAEPVTVTQAGA